MSFPALAPDPLVDLPQAIHNELRDLLMRIARAGFPLERNPNMPSMTATRIEGRMFQIGPAYDRSGEPTGIVILGPGQPEPFGDPNAIVATAWERVVFLALLGEPEPEAQPEPAPAPPNLRAIEIRPDEREYLALLVDGQKELIAEMRAIRARLEGRVPC